MWVEKLIKMQPEVAQNCRVNAALVNQLNLQQKTDKNPFTIEPDDYVAEDRILVFPAGEISQQITLNTTDDETPEVTENFQAFLSDPSNGASLGISTSAIEVIDDDGKKTDHDIQL